MSLPFCFKNEEGLAIRGDLHEPAAPGPVVVCLHGFKGFKDWGFWPEIARRLCDAGFGVVRFNFAHSGVGEDLKTFSEPRLFESGTYSREVADLREVLARLDAGLLPGSKKLDCSRVGLLAHSRGAVAALAVGATPESSQSSVRSVVLWNPVSGVVWWDESERRRWRQQGFWEVLNSRTGELFRVQTALLDDAESHGERLDPQTNARRLAIPLLVVVAREDESVPAQSGMTLVRAVPAGLGCLVEIPETGHTFGVTHPFTAPSPALGRAIDSTVAHFGKTLGRPE